MTRGRSSTSIAPGFRFHPTDEELLRYYLRRKVTNKPTLLDHIASIDIYKSEPWDLPSKSKLKTRDLEWYFYSILDKKYGNGSRTNRATEKGYWKTTGKDRPITAKSREIGMKKTLVYHLGRAPTGQRSNWVMHEYRLVDDELEKSGICADAYVLCRVFQKSGTGPKNGEQYGAPFIEEEWEEDDDDEEVKVVVPYQGKATATMAEEMALESDMYADMDDLKYVDTGIPSGVPLPSNFNGDRSNSSEQPLEYNNADIPTGIPLPSNFHHGDSSNSSEHPLEYGGAGIPTGVALGSNFHYGDCSNSSEPHLDNSVADEKPVTSFGDAKYASELHDDNLFFDIPEEYDLDAGLYIETNDLSNSVEVDHASFDVGDYLEYFDADGDTSKFPNSELITGECSIPDQEREIEKPCMDGTEQVPTISSHVLKAHLDNDVSSIKQKLEPEPAKFESDVKYPFIKKASHMLGNIPAPPAFASEFPSKEAILKLNSEGQSSSSVHVTAGMIRIRSMILNTSGMELSYGKNGNLNVILSFDVSQDAVSSSVAPTASLLGSKAGVVMSRGWYLLMFFWVFILSVSFKIASCIYTRFPIPRMPVLIKEQDLILQMDAKSCSSVGLGK